MARRPNANGLLPRDLLGWGEYKRRMQIKVFTLPLQPTDEQTEELNHFLRAKKVIDVKKELASVDGNHLWTFCVSYLDLDKISMNHPFASGNVRQEKKDYRKILSPEDFERFSDLRKIRKTLADAEAVPAYAVFTDAELAEVAKLQPLTIKGLQGIPGIGSKKVEKYGEAFCRLSIHTDDEACRSSDGKNC